METSEEIIEENGGKLKVVSPIPRSKFPELRIK